MIKTNQLRQPGSFLPTQQDRGYNQALVGNGQIMIYELKTGLEKTGVVELRMMTESNSSHKAESDLAAIENIASAVAVMATVQA